MTTKDTTQKRLRPFFALLSGTLFGLGLAVSGMVYPAKVLAFLDISGAWDPTLAFVMLGALSMTTPAFRYVLKRRQPWYAPVFALPTRTDLDPRLVLGASLFGIGWGIAGLCPGPALTALVSGEGGVYAFVASMLAGFLLHDWVTLRGDAREAGVRLEHGKPR
jgi:uncharacterized membrane protein YedE/YeeE